MLDWIRRHRNLTIASGVVIVGLVVFVFLWFEPHKAFIDERVDETIPVAAPIATSTTSLAPIVVEVAPSTTLAIASVTTNPPASSTTTSAAISYPLVLSETVLAGVAHSGSGTVLILELEDGRKVLRYEDLDVLNGPDLLVILSDRAVSGADDYADGEYLILGELKGNQGNQNYEIPVEIDLSDWATSAIWCRRFNTTFNVAPLDL